MKFIIFSVLAFVALSSGKKCEEGTYLYNSNCGPIMLEPTCDSHESKVPIPTPICDYTDCYCNPPTVRELSSNKCVTIDKCPKPDFQIWFEQHPELHPELAKKEKPVLVTKEA